MKISNYCVLGLVLCATTAALAVNVPAAPKKPAPPFGRSVLRLPPEAFTTPTNYVLVVNHNGAVKDSFLEDETALMKGQLSSSVRYEAATGEIGNDPRGFVEAIRAKHGNNAKIVIVVSEEKGLTPILTAPYEYWVVMDAAWVKAGGGDEATQNLRMGKRMFQALGHAVGAGHRMEREACMRYTPTAKDLDDCLSHGFHPLNSSIFMQVQEAIGLDRVRIRPRNELIEMGIIKAPAAQ